MRKICSAVETRNLAPLPADVDHIVAAALPISGLTAWQGLFDHGRLAAGQTVLIHGAAGGVGSMAVQLAREVGARVIGTGRAGDRDTAFGLGADAFLDLQTDGLEGAGEVDLVFDVIGGEILDRSAALVRSGGTLDTIATPPTVQPKAGRAIFFVVEPRSFQARGPRSAAPGRPAQANRRGRAGTPRRARRVRPRAANPGKDDHPGHRRLSRRAIVIRTRFAGGLLAAGMVATAAACGSAAEPPSGRAARVSKPPSETLSPLLEEALPDVNGKTFTSALVDFPPAARAAPHRHGEAFVYAYVLDGTVRSQLDGEPMRTYRQGENWVEQPGAHHVLTENTSTTAPAKLLVIFISNTGDQLKVDDPPQ